MVSKQTQKYDIQTKVTTAIKHEKKGKATKAKKKKKSRRKRVVYWLTTR
jgi:hypothetical protein